MGATTSSTTKNTDLVPKGLGQTLNYIATRYILTASFKDLVRLNDKSYCDELIVLTEEVLKEKFTTLDIANMDARVSYGRHGLEGKQKTTACRNVAKFYIKIAHLFAAIMTTVNPSYTYKDQDGTQHKDVAFHAKGDIPTRAARKINRNNVCDNRIRTLTAQSCKTAPHTLFEEPGMVELEGLYMDSEYDYKTGMFLKRSASSQAEYEADLAKFYRAFTAKNDVPKSVRRFADVQVRDCSASGAFRHRAKPTEANQPLFEKYGQNLRQMTQNANERRDQLTEVLAQVFVYTFNSNTRAHDVQVNPALTQASLQQLIVKTRGIIAALYMTCEAYYARGLQIYEAIVNAKVLTAVPRQQKALAKAKNDLF